MELQTSTLITLLCSALLHCAFNGKNLDVYSPKVNCKHREKLISHRCGLYHIASSMNNFKFVSIVMHSLSTATKTWQNSH